MPLSNDLKFDANRLPATVPVSHGKSRITPLPRPAVINSEVVFSDDTTPFVPTPRSGRLTAAWRILFPLLALGLGLLAACGMAELLLRAFGYGRNYTNPMSSFFEPDSELGCHGKANFVGRFRRADFDALVEHDEYGFRCSTSPIDQAARHDVYVLGDSFVWGYGVGQQDLLTNQMAQRLSGLRVHNLGLIGAGTVQEYLIFQKHVVDRLRPGDTVVLVFFGNDFGDNVGLHGNGRVYATIDRGQVSLVAPRPASAMQQWKSWMKDRSYLFNLVTYCADCFQDGRCMKNLPQRTTRHLPSPEKIEADSCDISPAVQITRHYVLALKDACRAKQVHFLVVNVPGQAELGEDDVTSTSDLCLSEEIACRQAFERMVSALAVDTVDLMTPMLAAKRTGRFERLTFAHDFHWNPVGHTIAAETIAAAIK